MNCFSGMEESRSQHRDRKEREAREFFESSEFTGAELVISNSFYEIGVVPAWQPLSPSEHDHWLTWGN